MNMYEFWSGAMVVRNFHSELMNIHEGQADLCLE